MSNLEISVIYDAGTPVPLLLDSCGDAVQWLGGTDDDNPVRSVTIDAVADDGRRVIIDIPTGSGKEASVRIVEGEMIQRERHGAA